MSATTPYDLGSVAPDDFDVRTLDDEIRVDQRCGQLLLTIRDLLIGAGHAPLAAGDLCRGADYFLRDFAVAECHDNLFRLPAERIRQFGGHWYIVRTLEPNVEELEALLAGVAAVYRVLADHRLVAPQLAASIAEACSDLPFYRRRIEAFWAIEGDGYRRWCAACPLPLLPP